MQSPTIIPLKGTVEVKGVRVHFEAMKSEEPDQLPGYTDWWIEKLVLTTSGEELISSYKLDFETLYEDQIHEAIRAYCKERKEGLDYDYALGAQWR